MLLQLMIIWLNVIEIMGQVIDFLGLTVGVK